MWKLLLSIPLLATSPVFGQLDSHTLSISATRSMYLQPDQVLFGLSVNTSATGNLDQIVGALSGLGITSANLTGTFSSKATTLSWNFSYTAPLSSLTTTVSALAKLEQTISQNNSGLTLTFSVDTTEVSEQLRQSQSCSNSDLVADATAQGQKLAAAAGLTLGPILKLSNTPLTLLQPSFDTGELALYPISAGRVGTFGTVGADYSLSSFLVAARPSPVTCSLVVEFQLLS